MGSPVAQTGYLNSVYITTGDLEILTLCQYLLGTGIKNQSWHLVHARQALYQPSYIFSPQIRVLIILEEIWQLWRIEQCRRILLVNPNSIQ